MFERKKTMETKRYLKKTLSVILSLLMVLGTFCFFNPFKTTEAEAATAGKYTVTLEIDSGNDTGGWDWGNAEIRGKGNNGTNSTDAQIWYNSDAKVNFKGKRKWAENITTNLFPYKFIYGYSFGGGATIREMKFTVRIYVNGTLVAEQYHNAKSSIFKTAKGTKTTIVDAAKYPKVNSVAIGGNDLAITVPGNGVTTAATATTGSATVYDQYGVEWYQEPDSYIISSSSGATKSESITGISFAANSGYDTAKVSVSNAAKDWVSNNGTGYQRDVYVRAGKSGTWSSAKKVTLTNCTVTGAFYNYSESAKDWTTLAQRTLPYYNYNTVTSPTVTRTGWAFNGWSTDKNTASGDMTVSTKIKADTTWYAQWTKTVTGRFHYLDENGNAASYDSEKTLTTKETEYTATPPTAPSVITYDGRTFKFLGWRADTAASNELTTDFTIPSNYDNNVATVKDFYAVYSGDITLRFDGNDGVVSGENKSQTQYLNAAGNVTSHTFDITGVTASLADTDYAGWAETADANDALDANTTFTITSDKTVYAVYKCDVKFFNQGVQFGAAQKITYRHNAVDPSPLPDTAPADRPLKDFDDDYEYYFIGWKEALTNITGHTDINAEFNSVEHTYEAIDDAEHKYIKPKCLETGVQWYRCSHERNDNGEICLHYKKTILPAAGHKPVEVKGKDATCTEDGYTDSSYCAVCGEVIKPQEVLPKLGHDFENAEYVTVEATCVKDGYKVRYCTRCGVEDTDTKEIYKADFSKHSEMTVPEVPATCTENGMSEYTKCTRCGAIIKAPTTLFAVGHKYVTVPEVPATCTSVGCTAYEYCSVCSEVKTEKTELPMIPHDWDYVSAKAATCTEQGYKAAGKVCKNCNTVEGTEIIPALGHTYDGEPTVKKEATCSEEGIKVGKCSVCGEEEAETVIPKLEHTPETIPAVAATCIAYGWTEGERCSVCNTIIKEPTRTTDKVDHKWAAAEEGYKYCTVCGVREGHVHSHGLVTTKAATCGKTGEAHYRCGGCGDVIVKIIPALTHIWVSVPEKAATCTEDGYTQGSKCEICGEWYTEPTVITSSGHSYGEEQTKPATCTEAGKKYKVCSVCGEEEIIEVLEKASHSVVVIPAVAATCTKYGLTAGAKCSVCGEIITAQTRTEAKDHVEKVTVAAKAPTCSACGNTEEIRCADCNKLIKKAQNIAALSHTLSSWSTVTKNTCTAKGSQERHCTAEGCTYKEYRTLNPTGHSYSSYVITVYEPSCEKTGLERSVCSSCQAVQDKEIPNLGHTEITVKEVPAKCGFEGTTAGTKCFTCGVTMSGLEKIPALEHNWILSVHVDGGCENDSYDIYVCTYNNEHTKTDNIAAAPGHEGGTATCVQKAVCDVCHEEYGDYGEHSYSAVVTAPTCTKEGYTTYTCTVCQKSYAADTVPAKDHSVAEWTLNEDAKTASGTCTECNETVTRAAEESDYKECERCGLRHTRTTGLMKYKGIVCSLRYFFRQIAKLFKGGK